MSEKKFKVSGMTCSACVTHVEKSVAKVQGIKWVQVNLLTNSMVVEYDEGVNLDEAVRKAVEDAGYVASLKIPVEDTETPDSSSIDLIELERISTKKRWTGSLAFLVPLMYLSMGPMAGFPLPDFLSHTYPMTNALMQFMLSIPIYIYNKKYFQTGFKSLYHLAPNMDSLIAIGSGAAMVYGILILFRMSYAAVAAPQELMNLVHDLYFESGATILTLITIGKYLEAKSKSKTTTALEKLIKLKPTSAIVMRNGVETVVAVEKLQVGDILLLRSGGQVPVDGEIVWGEGDFDESALTGESMPVHKETGSAVLSATHLKTGFVQFRASRVGNDTTLSKIIQLVEDASSSKAPVQRLADKISGVFVPVVIAIALLSVVAWLLAGHSLAFALSIGISVLVISCPCALGLATPVAIMVGTGKAASLGVLFKNATAIEISDKIDTVVFDKTGTLTEGKPVVTHLISGAFFPENKLLELAMTLEKASEHIFAEAILKEADKRKLEALSVTNIRVYEGKGIRGEIQGRVYAIGNERLLSELNLNPKNFIEKAKVFTDKGETPLYVANHVEVLGVILVADKLRPDSKALVHWLKSQKKEVVLLTGDHVNVAEAIRREAGIDRMFAETLPGDKEGVIRKLQEEGRVVAMVGDGINDAPALTRSDLGIAVGSGTDIAIDSADVVLLHPRISDLSAVFNVGNTVMKQIKQNLFWAFFYNVAGIPLAAGAFYLSLGWKLNPMFAAAAMSVSSVTVVLNALRINRLKSIELWGNEKDSLGESAILNTNNEIKIKSKMKIMQVEGMTCGHCKMRVEKALNSLEGVRAEVDLASGKVSVQLQTEVADNTLIEAVTNAGYEVKSINPEV